MFFAIFLAICTGKLQIAQDIHSQGYDDHETTDGSKDPPYSRFNAVYSPRGPPAAMDVDTVAM
jgi:hypothetical protein